MAALFLTAISHAEIYTFYSDNGIPQTPAFTVDTFGCSLQFPAVCTGGPTEGFSGNASDVAPPEGFTSWKTTATFSSANEYAGWGLHYGVPQDLSRFNSGELRFWIYTSTGNIKVEIKNAAGGDVLTKNLAADLGWTAALANQWVEYRLPLAGAALTQTSNPFLFTALGGPATFYIDNVRYVDASVGPNYFNATLQNRSDNAAATQVTWNGLSLPRRWALADQYIQLTVDSNVAAWGVQIYTDNTAAAASPKFTGDPAATDPGGLVDNAAPTKTLTMAWSIHPDTFTTTAAAGNPDVDTEWLYLQDQKTPAFSNGLPYATVKTNAGIQYAPVKFGAQQVPPNPIYLEANFSNAVTPNTYKTNELIIEYFTQ